MASPRLPFNFLLLLASCFLSLNLYFAPLNVICENQRLKFVSHFKITKYCAKILKRIENHTLTIKQVTVYSVVCPNIDQISEMIRTSNCNGTLQQRNTSSHMSTRNRTLNVDQTIQTLNSLKIQILNQFNVTSTLEAVHAGTSNLSAIKLHLLNDLKEVKRGLEYLSNVTSLAQNIESSCEGTIETPEMTRFLANRDDRREAIFFTETSGAGFIKARFVCALESAARAYNNSDVYLLFASAPATGLVRSQNEALYSVLRHYPHVKVLKIDMEKLFMKSPLEKFYLSNRLSSSKYYAAHSSDIIRSLVVWMYGGKYFDLDIITLERLPYTNFYIHQTPGNESYLANGAFGFKKHSIVGDYMFEFINQSFVGDDWAYNGPRVLTEALSKYVGVDLTNLLIDEPKVKDFVHLAYNTLFPIEFFDLLMYFDEHRNAEVMRRLSKVKGLWGLHIGNNLIKANVVKVGSNQAYGLLAQKFCPRAYWSCFDDF